MDNKEMVYKYFLEELKVNQKVSDTLFTKVSKYEDIFNSFVKWLNERSFENILEPEIEGFTPKYIGEKYPHLKGIGVFNVFVRLKDDKEKTLDLIKKGFPRK